MDLNKITLEEVYAMTPQELDELELLVKIICLMMCIYVSWFSAL